MPFLRSLLLLSVLLLTFACEDDDDIITPMEEEPTMPTDIRYLALGDSYTIGTAVAAEERWPAQLADRLAEPAENAATYTTKVDVVAVNGWTTRNLINGIAARDTLADRYDLVSLLIGVNNQFRGGSVGQYETEFTELLETAMAFAGGERERLIVVSIPDYAFTTFGGGGSDISEGVARFNAAARAITEAAGVDFLNITPISKGGLDDPTLVATDGLHPSGKQYGIWVEEVILEVVREKLGA